MEARSIDKDLELTLFGEVIVSSFETKNGKIGRRANFIQISAISPRSPVLERRLATRSRYEREGWHRPINSKERHEYRLEANSAHIRARQFDDRAQVGETASVHFTPSSVPLAIRTPPGADWRFRQVRCFRWVCDSFKTRSMRGRWRPTKR